MSGGLWACPECHTIKATESRTYPPGHTHAEEHKGCDACGIERLPPGEWERVNV